MWRGLLLYDPVNIRYTFDSVEHERSGPRIIRLRYALILSGGPGIMFEFKGCEHLNDGLPGIDELRTSIGWMFMNRRRKGRQPDLARWADEIADELAREYGGGNMRLARGPDGACRSPLPSNDAWR